MDTRDRIRSGIDFSSKRILEIGPLYRPFVLKSEADVVYVDHADTETLRSKYKDDPKFDKSTIVNIDAVWGQQTLADCLGVDRKVDFIIASHVVEHVPDLLTWLKELRSVLTTNGEIRLVVPDKRFTFDYTRRLTELPEVLDAYLRKARRPLPWNILDHVINVRHVDVGSAWSRKLGADDTPLHHTFELAIHAAQDALSTTNYHDVHCWVFTPASFAALMFQAAQHELLDLSCVDFQDTPHNSLEFIVHLKATNDRCKIVDSWKHVFKEANQAVPGSVDYEVESLKTTLAQTMAKLEQQTTHIKLLESALLEEKQSRKGIQHNINRSETMTQGQEEIKSWKIASALRKLATCMRNF